MTPEQWQEIRSILESALELDPAHRSAFLDSACRDSYLRGEVESLLASHEQADTNLLNPASAPVLDTEEEARYRLPTGKRIGAYEIREEIAEGGMGAVYRGVRADGMYDKQVAIKLIRGGLSGNFFVSRFKNERQILAGLEHPNIARLLDGGVTEEGLPFVVLEFVAGVPIDEYCARHDLSVADRLKLFRAVCSAVQYAHQNLVVHRDLKPGNILVTEEGIPKLLDFGIAKILAPQHEDTGADRTLTVMRIMTPDFASPEQVRGESITTSSDVYSLGVILYLLLTGLRPYRVSSTAPHEIIKAICDTDPEKPSTAVTHFEKREKADKADSLASTAGETEPDPKQEKLRRALAGDLDNIVLKALRKEPDRRYATVEQFSEDVRRHLEHLPVIARKDTASYRTSKFILRHKPGVAVTAAFALTLVAGLVITLREARIARANQIRAEQRFNDVRRLANSLIFEIHDGIRDLPGSTGVRKLLADRALEYLDSLAKETSGDISLQRELATAYERVGDVQGKPRTRTLGDTGGALQSYRKSLALREAIARNDTGDYQDKIRVATVSREVAELLAVSGNLSGALEQANRAVTSASSIVASDSSDHETALSELLSDYVALGLIEYNSIASASLDKPDAALQDYQRGLEVASELLKRNPSDPSVTHQRAVIYERIGRILLRTGRRADAIRNLNVSLDIFRSLAADPDNARAQRNLGASVSMFGDALAFDGRFREALAYYQEELTIFQKLSGADPRDLDGRMALAGSYYDVGSCLMRQGKLDEALPLVRRAISMMDEGIALNSKSVVYRSALGSYRVAEAETLGRMHQPAKAVLSYRAALEIYDSTARSDNHNADARLSVTATEAKIAATLLQLGDQVNARELFNRAARASEPAASAAPPNLQAQCTLADAYAGLGDVASRLAVGSRDTARKTAYWVEASTWYEESLRIWHTMPNRSFISPNGFDTGDPANVAKSLRICEAWLSKPK